MNVEEYYEYLKNNAEVIIKDEGQLGNAVQWHIKTGKINRQKSNRYNTIFRDFPIPSGFIRNGFMNFDGSVPAAMAWSH